MWAWGHSVLSGNTVCYSNQLCTDFGGPAAVSLAFVGESQNQGPGTLLTEYNDATEEYINQVPPLGEPTVWFYSKASSPSISSATIELSSHPGLTCCDT